MFNFTIIGLQQEAKFESKPATSMEVIWVGDWKSFSGRFFKCCCVSHLNFMHEMDVGGLCTDAWPRIRNDKYEYFTLYGKIRR